MVFQIFQFQLECTVAVGSKHFLMHAAPKFLEVVVIDDLLHLLALFLSVRTILAIIGIEPVEVSVGHLRCVDPFAERRMVSNKNFFLNCPGRTMSGMMNLSNMIVLASAVHSEQSTSSR